MPGGLCDGSYADLTSNGVDEMIKRTFGLWTGEYDLDMDESELNYQLLKSLLSGSDISDAELKKLMKVKKVKEE